MKKINYKELSKEMLEQLEKGAFLTVKNKEKVNPMTIGWGSVGYIWNRPIFTVLVRYSRFTHELLKNTDEFTVSVPIEKNLSKALGICGTQSGRDIDKIKAADLTLQKSLSLETPIIKECDLHFECKIVHKQSMEPALLDEEIRSDKYSDNDYHVIYYGEIVESYQTE
jgi:flavin reductase (DIM6/NTAB) family NADH-FMN oxidoreductase RutF